MFLVRQAQRRIEEVYRMQYCFVCACLYLVSLLDIAHVLDIDIAIMYAREHTGMGTSWYARATLLIRIR